MKNIIESIGYFIEGAARIFDFAGVMSEDNLHETHDGTAINKDWKAVRSDFRISKNNMSEGINDFKKKTNKKN
ncbi:MAG: hypothetical protein P4L27_14015 [Ignavibacteriaceae bacterium]|nr:hypothetical protein [Ignavibacteriaceae bacterium]